MGGGEGKEEARKQREVGEESKKTHEEKKKQKKMKKAGCKWVSVCVCVCCRGPFRLCWLHNVALTPPLPPLLHRQMQLDAHHPVSLTSCSCVQASPLSA